MADDEAELTQEEKARAAAWVERHAGPTGFVCSVCKSTDWILGDHIIAPVAGRPGQPFRFGGKQYPHFALICRVCCHTVFFNALGSGVITPEPAPPKEPGKGDG